MQKEIKGLYTIYGMWLFFGIIGMIFISFNLPSALQKNDTVGIVFSIVFGMIFLAMILGFGHLIRVAPKKCKKNTRISSITIQNLKKTWNYSKRMRLLSIN